MLITRFDTTAKTFYFLKIFKIKFDAASIITSILVLGGFGAGIIIGVLSHLQNGWHPATWLEVIPIVIGFTGVAIKTVIADPDTQSFP